MQKGSTIVLRCAVLAIAAATIIISLVILPAGLKNGWDGYRPIVVGMYVAAVPFFIALYQAIKLLGHIDRNEAFSEASVTAIRTIKRCALAISLLYAIGMPVVYRVADKDDAPGVIVIGLVIIFASFVVAVFAGVLQKLIRSALDIKSENDLTV